MMLEPKTLRAAVEIVGVLAGWALTFTTVVWLVTATAGASARHPTGGDCGQACTPAATR